MTLAIGYIGIDPGASGAAALFMPDPQFVAFFDMPKLTDGGGLDHWTLASRMEQWARVYDIRNVVIEKVSAMPGQGVVSMFSFGQNFGAVKQAVASTGMSYTLVAPQAWKRVYKLQGGRENKGASAARVAEMFPAMKEHLYGPKGGVKDGRAEAVLLAHYGSTLQ